MTTLPLIPGLVWLSVVLLTVAVPVRADLRPARSLLGGLIAAATVAIWSPSADLAYLGVAVGTLLLAGASWRRARTGSIVLIVSGIAALAASVEFRMHGAGAGTLFLSLAALAVRFGVFPLHAGVVSLSRQAPVIQALQFGTLLALVLAHLRFADHVPAASSSAPLLVQLGVLSAVFFALTTLTQPQLRGFLQGSTLMHGGLMFAAAGAAGRGHQAGALFVAMTMALAVGGLTYLVLSLESRTGAVGLQRTGGRGRAFPRLAAAFAFLAAAGVGMPGTAGFIADDLLLHALWEESVAATVGVALAAALLAIATLRAIAQVFFGTQQPSAAPDLVRRERLIAVAFVILLIGIGLFPMLLTSSAPGVLGAAGMMG